MTTDGTPSKGDVIVLVGTRKGGFILSSAPDSKDWKVSGPHNPGGDIYHMLYDSREGSIYSANNSIIWGPSIEFSRDLGESWQQPTEQPKFGVDTEKSVGKMWHVEPGRDFEPGVVYAGVDPASLFRSEDSGKTWQGVHGLNEHPTRDQWQPGLGGLCLHSMVLDPHDGNRMWVGISAVGVFGTGDGGETWHPMNKGIPADFLPDRFPDFGQCTHKLLSPSGRPERLYQQNHCGVFRSDNGGELWNDITEGLPSRFGFVLGLHSQDPDTLYVLPEDKVLGQDVGGGNRLVTDAQFRVFRSRNAGLDWEPMTKGLPQRNAYLHGMREGMATDSLDPCGVYVGTTNGQVFYSRNDGDSWELMVDYLPPINSIEAGIVG